MKNQVRPVCSRKDKIWSRTDKLQRCHRLPQEQDKLRQILENKSEGILIRKLFDRWYVAESLWDRLRDKINHILILQQHESRRGWPIFPVWISTISTKSGNPPGNRGKSQGAHSMAWCLFTDFVHKYDCSLPDKFFVTGRFQVWFVQNKSEIALQCDLALSQFQMLIKTDVNYM